MTENFENKISRLTLSNFTCFSQADFEFSAGINVFIGENGTGKTHILKGLYGMLQNIKVVFSAKKIDTPSNIPPIPAVDYYSGEPFTEIFNRGVGDLVRKSNTGKNKDSLLVGIESNEKKLTLNFEIDEAQYDLNIALGYDGDDNLRSFKRIFIPAKEMLSWQKGFAAAYDNRENSFDKTYYDLAKAFDLLPLKKKPDLLEELENALNISVSRKNDEFYIKFKKENVELASVLVATGINKLAQLIYLIMNGSLTKESILFWDEPEVNLNPKYISLVAKFLQTLAKAGVQIFVATHDYLLIHQLSLAAEYRAQTDAPAMKFFSLTKGDDGTIVESGATLVEINNNAILDEYAAFYDLENSLFARSRP